jgi:protein arginine kinase activator
MNACGVCGAPATVHLTDIVNKKKRQTHLCEQCARDQDLISDDPTPQLNLQPLLQLIMSQMGVAADDEGVSVATPGGLTCDECGLKYAQFKAHGRLGCPHDYDAFHETLEPLLERIHRGLTHVGKVPAARRGRVGMGSVRDLRRRLAEAVADERYEDAAQLRDAIRAKDQPA